MLRAALALLLAAVLAQGACASSEESAAALPGGGWGGQGGQSDAQAGQGGTGGSGAGGGVGGGGGSVGGAAGGGAGTSALHPLCTLGCRLDDAAACPAWWGAPLDAGTLQPPEAGRIEGPDAFVGDDADAPGPDADGAPLEAGASAQACTLVQGDAGLAASCAPAGTGLAGAVCVDAADCAPGFGCVGSAAVARCRPFCCAGTASCAGAGTFCEEQPLRLGATDAGEEVLAPVCMPADDCSLSEPWPCPTGEDCGCTDGTACMVVRDDGTTACVTPGAGVAGEACPCAHGHICSQATQRCLLLCALAATDAPCGAGVCQGSPGLPEGWGVCVGAVDGG